MTEEPGVILDDPGGEGGLAAVVADLVTANLVARPRRARLLRRMRGTVTLVAEDEGESSTATLVFDGTGLAVRPGRDPAASVEVRAGYDGIVGLGRVPVRMGVPVPWRMATLKMYGAMIRGRVKVRGFLAHPFLVFRLLSLFSVS